MCNFGSLNFWIRRSGVFKLFINWLSLGSLLVAQEKSPGSSTKGGAVIFKEEISVKWIPWRCLECLDIRNQSSHHPRGFLRAKDHPIAFQPRVGREMDYVPKWQPSASSPVLISLFEKKKISGLVDVSKYLALLLTLRSVFPACPPLCVRQHSSHHSKSD